MRIIKFRAFDKTFKKMFYADTNEQFFKVMRMHKDKHYSDEMQFTGLLDKFGKEIYEGDILSFPENDEFIMEMSDVTKPVIYERGAYRVDVFDWFKKVLDDETALEGQIVGNVYENPELINNKE